MSEDVFFLSSLLIWFFTGGLTLLYLIRFKSSTHYVRIFLLFNLTFFTFVSLIWFNKVAVNDGISQVIGTFIYLGYAIIICILQIIFIRIYNRK